MIFCRKSVRKQGPEGPRRILEADRFSAVALYQNSRKPFDNQLKSIHPPRFGLSGCLDGEEGTADSIQAHSDVRQCSLIAVIAKKGKTLKGRALAPPAADKPRQARQATTGLVTNLL